MDLQMLISTGLIQVCFTLLVVVLVYNVLKNLFDKVIKKPSTPTTTRRRLGKSEALVDLLSQDRQGSSDICLNISLRSETKLVKEYVYNALVLLAKRQPMLRAIISISTPASWTLNPSTKEKYFEIIDGDQISDMIDFTSSDVKASEWQDVWYEVASKQRRNGLLWKTVILQEEFLSQANCYTNTLIFTFNHCCIDGVSCIKFCQQFLYYLNGLAEGSITSDKVISSLNLSPSCNDLSHRQQPWSLLQFLATCLGIPRISKLIFKTAVRWVLSRRKCNPFLVQFPPNPRPATPPITKIHFKIFTENETSSIVKACKLNGCTVTGALMAGSHLAFCKLIQDGEYSCKDVQLEHHFAVNAQRHCQPKPHKEYLGQFAHPQSLFIQCADGEGDFWKTARESTKRIQNDLNEEKYIKEILGILDCFSIEEVVNEFASPLERQRLINLSCCSAVSNAGSFDFREEQKHHRYRLHECLLNVLVHDMLPSFTHFTTTVNGKLSWILVYDSSKVVNDVQAERFANLCFEYFNKMNL